MNDKNPWSQRTPGCHCPGKRGLPFVVSAFTLFDDLWYQRKQESERVREGERTEGMGRKEAGAEDLGIDCQI